MNPYIVVLPNSPLLLHAFEKNQFLETKKIFQKVRDELRKKGITKVLTISDSPKYERSSFSIYTHPMYELSFADFGDLITKSTVPIWWEGYNLIQTAPHPLNPIELIDSSDIDYGHAVAIHLLETFRHPAEKIEYLALNNFHLSSKEQRNHLGKHLLASLSHSEEEFAIIFLGSLFQTKTSQLIKSAQIKNSDLREQINSGHFDFNPESDSKEMLHASITHVLDIASGLFENKPKVIELSFEKDERTCFYAAELL